ncbi:MAG: deoxynucleoside kinase, partial [Chloroflexota bacterium]
MTQFPYVAIEGVIGVGKTTLARYLQAALESELLLEVFEENPFLKDFYADRARYAFQNQTFFLLSRYRQQNQITDTVSHRPLVTDYLFHKNWIFAQLNLFDDELAVFENLYKALAKRIPIPRLVIYLRANVDTLMERIAIRDRPYERDMQRDYIVNLYQAYDVFFDGYTQSQVIT